MITIKELEKIKIKMVNENINKSKLARKIKCSNGSLTIIFQQVKNMPNVENRLKEWLNN